MRLIDADALLEYVFRPYSNEESYNNIDIKLIVESMPTVDPIKHGQWKPMDLTWGRSIYYCTNCGESAEVPTDMGKPIYMFCPNCGAIIDEVREDDKI